MKIAILYLVASVCWISVQSYYLDQSKEDDDWYQLLEDRNVEGINDGDEDVIAVPKRSHQYFEIEAPYKFLESSQPNAIRNKCHVVDDNINTGWLCRAAHENGSVCQLATKVQCTTIINKGESSRCKCKLTDHIDRCGRDILDEEKY